MAAAVAPELAARVAAALDDVADPCLAAAGIPGSIIELGLVQDIRADTDGTVEIDLALTEMGCAFTHHLLDAVWTVVEAVPGVTDARVSPTWTWEAGQIAPELAARLRTHADALPERLPPGRRRLPLLTT